MDEPLDLAWMIWMSIELGNYWNNIPDCASFSPREESECLASAEGSISIVLVVLARVLASLEALQTSTLSAKSISTVSD